MLPSVLICDDDPLFHMSVKLAFESECQFASAFNGDEAISLLKRKAFSLVLLDIQMRTPDEGLVYIRRIKETDPEISVVITSGAGDFPRVRDALKLGADDYVLKGLEGDELAHAIRRSVQKRSLVRCNERQSSEVGKVQSRHHLVGISPQIETLRRQIHKAKASSANVLIVGETGTGKEVVARLLRKSLANGSMEPFVTIDSSTIQSSMAESILFGHEKGAFTGAEKAQKGIFEEADGGVVYFDEIANMTLDVQSKLLRILEEKDVRRLGSSRVIPLEFRVICASNQDLEKQVNEGKFKGDLLQRLNIIPISIAPLRDRLEDIPGLVDYFFRREVKNQRRFTLSPEALSCLMKYHWPGNVRELAGLVLFLASMLEHDEVTVVDLPLKMKTVQPFAASTEKLFPLGEEGSYSFYSRVSMFEKHLLEEFYQRSKGKVSEIASLLHMDRSHLYSKLKEYGILRASGLKGQVL